MVYDNILQTVGNTPIVEIKHAIPDSEHTFMGKLEYMNPGSSVKDRIALAIIENAEENGMLKPGGTIIEATSGNTGMGLALVAAVKGYKAIFVMPDKISEEKRSALRAYGAKVVITPTAVEPEDPRSFYSVAKKLVEITPDSFYANQYHNPANPAAHYRTTGPEIWEQVAGEIDVFVAGAGTGGTLSGVGKYLKEKNPNIKIICADPEGSILHDLFYHNEVRTPAHSYKVEGIGEDMLPENVHFNVIDEMIKVNDEEAFSLCRQLAGKDGICVGPSSASVLTAAMKYAKTLERPAKILCMMADSGRAYLSKAFNEEWLRENNLVSTPLKSNTIMDLIERRASNKEVITADVSETVMDVVTKMKEFRISQLPVFSDKELVGLVDESDLLYPLTNGTLKAGDPVIHLIKGSIVEVDMQEKLEKVSELFHHGYVALTRDKNDNLFIVTKIDLLDFLGTVEV